MKGGDIGFWCAANAMLMECEAAQCRRDGARLEAWWLHVNALLLMQVARVVWWFGR